MIRETLDAHRQRFLDSREKPTTVESYGLAPPPEADGMVYPMEPDSIDYPSEFNQDSAIDELERMLMAESYERDGAPPELVEDIRSPSIPEPPVYNMGQEEQEGPAEEPVIYAVDNIKELQRSVGVDDDGHIGNDTVEALMRVRNLSRKAAEKIAIEAMEGRVFAMGRYQTIPDTMRMAVDNGIIDSDTVYNKEAQEKVMNWILKDGQKRKRLSAYLNGEDVSVDAAIDDLASEFASLPRSATARTSELQETVNANKAGNKITGSLATITELLETARNTQDTEALKDYIASKESGRAGYNAQNAGTALGKIRHSKKPLPIIDRTVNELLKTTGKGY